MQKKYFHLLAKLLFYCSSVPDSFDNNVNADKLRNELQKLPLKLYRKSIKTLLKKKDLISYYNFYNINYDVDHYFGMINTKSYMIATHVYKPEKSKKTIFFVHGFLLHSAAYKYLFDIFINDGYTIVAFDLPGHGMSTGDRASIDTFYEYQDVLKTIINETKRYLPELYCIIGISTGSGIIIDYLLDNKSDFKYHVIASPLIRSDKFILSKIGFFLSNWFIKNVKTLKRDSTSDKESLNFFHKKDPLKIRIMPTRWVKALYKWNKKIENSTKIIDRKLLVIQGDKDVVVQWKKNIKIIKKIFPDAEIKIIKNGKHDIYFDNKEIRNDVFNTIRDYLK